jgi:LysR family transcriptional regulator, cyn operon transcriptional activator
LLTHSLNAFHELDQAEAAINEIKGMQRGRLRIGCSGNHLLTETVVAFHKLYPGIELSVTELATDDTMEGLLHNRLDLGVVFLTRNDDQLTCIPLFDEELQLAVSAEHEFAQNASVKLEELKEVKLLQLQPKFFVRQMFDDCCREAGFTLQPVLELSTLESLLQLAGENIGCAVLPKSYAAGIRGTNVRAIPIVSPVPRKPVGAVYRRETFISASIGTFIRELTSQFK